MFLRSVICGVICLRLSCAFPSTEKRPLYQRTNSTLTNSTITNSTSTCSGNSASNRSTWCNYGLSTNYYDEGPTTGVVREYWFELTNSTASPDGVERTILAVNGSVPGPTIEADWGDTVRVHLTNNLQHNGTSLHFHGVRQNWTNSNDGVVSVTQCPTAPGNTITYEWKAEQYGSSWYHAHYALQAWEGVFGGIIVHGPATANYDVDLGSLFLSDWDHATVCSLWDEMEASGPPQLDTCLINGTNIWTEEGTTVGSRWETDFVSGSSYLLRLVNAAINTHFSFSIDNHTLQVIAEDFVPIVPYTTDVLSIGMGQRYDVIVTADKGDVASDFWLRAVPDSFCSDINNTDIRGIIHYDDLSNLVPYLSLNAGTEAAITDELNATVAYNSDNLYKWYLDDETFLVEWQDPTSLQILNDDTTYTGSQGVIQMPAPDEWIYLIIETSVAIPHPIHLHGHDFFVLAQGYGTYADVNPALQTTNPPRRDVTMLPANGYVVLAWQADNPGVWLAHCHIGWHTEEGFALQFVERYDEIAALYNRTELEAGCQAWDSWQNGDGLVQDDSGI
ncbi:hypothetical protein EJ03DRAFT_385072 [Teratosphaeria nubilosa]|uniref:laccase n=1 Tax=Teratosphaeria nubilosa TaxID=161662 RepID=A0A6G1KYW0_9PEZI|nr:hypothetical protein EJ03DRAFT_385072 [Teratosphaeria nubilosa]